MHAMPADPGIVTTVFDRLETQARATLEREGYPADRQELQRTVRLKYVAQFYDVEVQLQPAAVTTETLARASDDFERIYDELHGEGSGYREGGSQITGFTVWARGQDDDPPLANDLPLAELNRDSRPVYWSEYGEMKTRPSCGSLAASCPISSSVRY